MKFTFQRMKGAAGDLKELEYVSALHQTDSNVRRDGSITVQDIRQFLESRHGIEVTDAKVRNTILQGLGGGADEGEVLDQMEVVALLMIPTLLKAKIREVDNEIQEVDNVRMREQGVVEPPDQLIEKALRVIMEDMTGSPELDKGLTPDLLKQLFRGYGEIDLSDNQELLRRMIDMTGNRERLDVKAFAAGLTKDVQQYDLGNETRMSTNFQDVFRNNAEDSAATLRDVSDHDEETALRKSVTSAPSSYSQPNSILDLSADDEDAEDEAADRMERGGCISSGCRGFSAVCVDVATDVKPMLLAEDVKLTNTAPSIDTTAGTPRSKGLMILLWVTVQISYYAYWWTLFVETYSGASNKYCKRGGYDYKLDATWTNNGNAIACDFGASALLWVVAFTVLCLLGLILVGLGSLGNFIGSDWKKPAIGATVVVLYTAISFALFDKSNYSRGNKFLAYMSLVLGIIVVGFHAIHLIAIVQPQFLLHHLAPQVKKHLMSSAIFSEVTLKKACNRKLTRMARNALALVENPEGCSALNTHLAQGLDSFAKHESCQARDSYETAGGFLWTWGHILLPSREHAVDGEGIFLSSRLIASNISQFIVSLYILLAGISLVDYVSHTFDSKVAQKELVDMVAKTVITTMGWGDSEHHEAIEEAVTRSAELMFPSSKYMVTHPVMAATLVAFLVSAYLALTYLPSVTCRILQLRSGVIPTLHDPDFFRYRQAPDQVSILTGSLFWGCLVGSLAVGAICGMILFFFVWQVTAYLAQRMAAFLVGILLILGIRWAVEKAFRFSFYHTAFYRKRPAHANITMLALEWAYFALSFGFVFLRLVKLMLVACTFVGRIDRPLLARGVGKLFGFFELDNYPTVHTKDLLRHEAHRHPYIELLGVMYMMKLRHGDGFGNTAGSCWRLLFVYALFPWLRRFRIEARPNIRAKWEASLRHLMMGGATISQDIEHGCSSEDGSRLQPLVAATLDMVSLRRIATPSSEQFLSSQEQTPNSPPLPEFAATEAEAYSKNPMELNQPQADHHALDESGSLEEQISFQPDLPPEPSEDLTSCRVVESGDAPPPNHTEEHC